MAIPVYLAMTSAEIQNTHKIPQNVAYWYPLDFPAQPNRDSLLVFTDEEAFRPSKVGIIADNLVASAKSLQCRGILLDFQHENRHENAALVTELEARKYPFAVTALYAENRNCVIFLPPVPLTATLADYIGPWQGREVWLELAMDGLQITVTAQGSQEYYLSHAPSLNNAHIDQNFHCHYSIESAEDRAVFTLWRTKQDIEAMLNEASALPVRLAVGLWQEFQ